MMTLLYSIVFFVFAFFYLPMFIVAGTLYLVALAVIHALAPRLEPARLEAGE